MFQFVDLKKFGLYSSTGLLKLYLSIWCKMLGHLDTYVRREIFYTFILMEIKDFLGTPCICTVIYFRLPSVTYVFSEIGKPQKK